MEMIKDIDSDKIKSLAAEILDFAAKKEIDPENFKNACMAIISSFMEHEHIKDMHMPYFHPDKKLFVLSIMLFDFSSVTTPINKNVKE